MNVNVRGKNIVVTPALKEYVEKKITKITRQFKPLAISVQYLKLKKATTLWKLPFLPAEF